MIARRPPSSRLKPYLTPIPGRRVSRRSTGIVLASLLKSREGEEPSADRLRLLHQHDADRRRGEDVEPGERNEVGAVACSDRRVAGGDLGEHDGELPVRDQGNAGVEALAPRKPTDQPAEVAARSLRENSRGDRGHEQPPDVPHLADVDREPEDEEEQCGEDIPKAEEALLDLV